MSTSSPIGRPSRRAALAVGVSAAAGLVTAGSSQAAPARSSAPEPPGGRPVNPAKAWRLLAEGNARFAEGSPRHPHQDPAWRRRLADGQAPFACVLGCADSRVPPEIVFDRGLGDLFTIRSAGEVLDDAVVGSIEYAVRHLHVSLLVVLGHSGCGAVTAAVNLVQGEGEFTGAISTLVRDIEPTVRATPPEADDEAFLAACVANQAKRAGVELTERSEIVREATERRALAIVPAVYDLASGRVER